MGGSSRLAGNSDDSDKFLELPSGEKFIEVARAAANKRASPSLVCNAFCYFIFLNLHCYCVHISDINVSHKNDVFLLLR